MALTLDIPQTVSPVDALWTLIMSQSKAVKKELIKRVKALSKEEAKVRKLQNYEKTLTQSQREEAQSIANSISLALKDVKSNDYKGTPLKEFLMELENEV